MVGLMRVFGDRRDNGYEQGCEIVNPSKSSFNLDREDRNSEAKECRMERDGTARVISPRNIWGSS
jgi:hypothetical protein